ncbi:MAG: TRAP transporter small permease subunit [Rhodospirillales bacterium]|nr:TRAP transporter small permease subunit [Rhodospirillales bacterium]MDE2199018.1 TRAP transporter small permease subunit [Rhodospirillales bacterium]MDE2573886.1 TRAP transporter small permease subunit [Rhodospirillales bacterium]
MRRLLTRAASGAGVLMFAGVFAVFMLKVVLRYVFATPLPWADEVSSVLFVWIIFWANATMIADRQHIAFDLVVRALPLGGQRAAAILRNLILGGLFAAALPAALGYIAFLWRETTPVLQWRLDWVYACFGIFLVAVCIRAVASLWALCRSA